MSLVVPNFRDMQEQVEFLSPTKAKNSYGEDVITWESVATLRAKVMGLQGNELAVEGQKWGKANYLIVVPFVQGISSQWRILWAGRTLEVIGIPTDATGSRLVLNVIAREPDAA